jgi:hypothetical protein
VLGRDETGAYCSRILEASVIDFDALIATKPTQSKTLNAEKTSIIKFK